MESFWDFRDESIVHIMHRSFHDVLTLNSIPGLKVLQSSIPCKSTPNHRLHLVQQVESIWPSADVGSKRHSWQTNGIYRGNGARQSWIQETTSTIMLPQAVSPVLSLCSPSLPAWLWSLCTKWCWRTWEGLGVPNLYFEFEWLKFLSLRWRRSDPCGEGLPRHMGCRDLSMNNIMTFTQVRISSFE